MQDNSTPKADVDADLMRERYRKERNKRVRSEGTDQFILLEGRFAEFADDPYADAPAEREAVQEDLDFLAIGGGFGGLQVGAELRKRGIDNFRIVEVGADFGGTWYWNRYPGLRCDVESYIYLPLLEETGYIPTERYVRGTEIFAYCQQLGHHFRLYERALFQTRVVDARWDVDAHRWVVTTDRGDTFRARFVTTQSGIFSRPQLPGIRGIKDFKGHSFHSARWDYDYTGGSSHGPLDKLADKKVGIIGTGTTALQVIPEVAQSARSLTVFQRTPSAIGIRDNGATDVEWFKSQPQGWQKERIANFTRLSCRENVECGLDDGWARFFRGLIAAGEAIPQDQRTPEAVALAEELADYQYNEMVRARVDEFVGDPQKAALLKAYYRFYCKRPGFSDDYLPAVNRDNVTLVDVSGGIDCLTDGGMVVDGVEYPLDCLIYCTGFELGTTWAHQAGYDVTGREGQLLSEKWKNGLVTFQGLFSRGFPNMFFMGLTQTAATTNVTEMLAEQIDHIMSVVEHCLSQGKDYADVTESAEQDWQDVMARMNEMRRPFQEACTPGYFNAEARPDDTRSAIGSGIYAPATEFFRMREKWRQSGEFAGLEFG